MVVLCHYSIVVVRIGDRKYTSLTTPIIQSRYLRFVENDEKIIVYHSLYGNPVQIGKEVKPLLNGLKTIHSLEDILSTVPQNSDIIETLIKLGFIISPVKDEYALWLSEIQKLSAQQPLLSGGIIFVLTTACNLSCRYCISCASAPSNTLQAMLTPQPAMCFSIARNAIVKYMEHFSSVCNPENNAPTIIFTGGEPLLQFETLADIVKYIAENYPTIECQYRIITNGTLLNPKIAAFLAVHHFDIIISLDGTKEVNDHYRLSNGPSSTEHQIWQGIQCLLDAKANPANISLSAVYNEEHPEGLTENLFRRIAGTGIGNYNVNLNNCRIIQSPPHKLAQRFMELRKLGAEFGIIISGRWAVPAQLIRSKQRVNAVCSGSARQKLFIQPDGSISFCDYHSAPLGHIQDFPRYVAEIEVDISRYAFGSWSQCKGCEIEGFCSPCVLEKEVLHKDTPLFQPKKCEWLKSCTRHLLLE